MPPHQPVEVGRPDTDVCVLNFKNTQEIPVISNLELRSLIEGSFSPFTCQCTVTADACLTVRVFDASTGRVELLVTGICASDLSSAHAINQLISELRDELACNQHPEKHRI